MIELRNDYSQGAHERILDKLAGINRQPNQGYGADDYCRAAQERVRRLTGKPETKLWFIPGGTQANLDMATTTLRFCNRPCSVPLSTKGENSPYAS